MYNGFKINIEQEKPFLLMVLVVGFTITSMTYLLFFYPAFYKYYLAVGEFGTFQHVMVSALVIVWLLCGIVSAFSLAELLYRFRTGGLGKKSLVAKNIIH